MFGHVVARWASSRTTAACTSTSWREMYVVCDKQDMFVPVPEGVLCDVTEAQENIAKLMENTPQIFQGTKEYSGVSYRLEPTAAEN